MAMSTLPVLDSVSSIIAAVIAYAIYTVAVSPLNRLPGSSFLTALGDLWRLLTVQSGKAHEVQRQLHEQYKSPLVRIGRKAVSINDPDLIRTIYSSENVLKKSSFYAVQDHVVGGKPKADVFSTRNEKWHSKEADSVHSLYSTGAVSAKERLVDKIVHDFCVRLDELFVRDRAPVDLHNWLHFLSLDLITALTYGRPVGFSRFGSDIDGIIADSKNTLEYRTMIGQISWLDSLLDKNPYFRSGLPTKSAKAMHDVCRRLPAVAKSTAPADTPMAPATPTPETPLHPGLRVMYQATVSNGTVSHASLKDSSASVTSSADGTAKSNGNTASDATNTTDATSTATKADKEEAASPPSWALARLASFGADKFAIELRAVVYFLARNPSKARKLVQELDGYTSQMIGGHTEVLSASAAKSLPYLDAVIKEALRLHPAIALPLERTVSSNGLLIRGFRMLPVGTIVGINPAVVSRNTDIYGADVDAFVPERWLPLDRETAADSSARLERMQQASLTFGAGKRACPAKELAEAQLAKVVGTLFSRYGVQLAVPGKEWRTRNVWLHHQWDMDCLLTPRVDEDYSREVAAS